MCVSLSLYVCVCTCMYVRVCIRALCVCVRVRVYVCARACKCVSLSVRACGEDTWITTYCCIILAKTIYKTICCKLQEHQNRRQLLFRKMATFKVSNSFRVDRLSP